MKARAIMFQGTGSDVGKSLVVAGLCRLFARKGLRVAPFKAQNMSNNAAVTEGGEIGRAQWLQALAAGVKSSVHMNPILLKPQSDRSSQVIVRGKVSATMNAQDYQAYRPTLLPQVLESYYQLAKNADIILAEGAGSPAEINLRQGDIANMGFARAAHCPVVLIGDIDRGGVIASIVGTHTVLPPEDRSMIRGFLINKFRGDPALFDKGASEITRYTGWSNLGLIPHHPSLMQLPQEDSLALFSPRNTLRHKGPHIVILTYPHIANFDDLDPLQNEPNIRVTWLREGDVIPTDAALVVLPGSKATIADLAFLRAQGWDKALHEYHQQGGKILGICGGYQMLGALLADPEGIEGAAQEVVGLGLLDISTVFTRNKILAPWQGTYGEHTVTGFEMHCGISEGTACTRPYFAGEGARSKDNKIWGTYVHGLFVSDDFRRQFLQELGAEPSHYHYYAHIHSILDGWADILEQTIPMETLLSLAMPVKS